jgi:hypothetical protein
VNIEWARNIGAIILLMGAMILGVYLGSTDISNWEENLKDSPTAHMKQVVRNNAIILRIAAIGLVVLLVFVGISLIHLT